MDFEEMEYHNITTEKSNMTIIFHKNTTEADIDPFSSLSSTANMTTTFLAPSSATITSSTSTTDEYQYYIIGVYAFFATMFSVGLVMILVRKFKQACCRSTTYDYHDYESAPNEGNINGAFEHSVNADSLDGERRTPEHDSDYDYYTDSESETDNLKDRPPEYEHPPEYSVELSK